MTAISKIIMHVLFLCTDWVRYNIKCYTIFRCEISVFFISVYLWGYLLLTSVYQVLSQTLSYINIENGQNSLDWGTLIVYTCKKSCRIEGYAREFVWQQDYSDKDLVMNK